MDVSRITFEDFFKFKFSDKTKVKFNMNAGDTKLRAWDYLFEDSPRWIEMNAHKTKHANHNLNKADYLLAFAQYYPYGPEFYVFGGLYDVKKQEPETFEGVGYELTLLPQFQEYRKRLIIKLKKPIGRDIYNKPFNSIQRDFDPEVFEITPSVSAYDIFPGYNKVLLTHEQLEKIFRSESPKWKDALSVVKGVYCITDKSTGKLYIGSASGDAGGIWQRWSSYADLDNLTGGNKTFEEIKERNPNYIINNFTYSILEIFDIRTKSDYIIEREEFWKRVFQSVKFGMNNTR